MRGPYKVRVAGVVAETADARSFVLEPAAGDREAFRYRPGQFLTLRVPLGPGLARCYSLSSSPHCDEPMKVTVKRAGPGSSWLCDTVAEGDVLEVLRPAGAFTPGSLDADLLLLAAGSGITPVMSIVKSCLAAGTGSLVLVYANRDERSVIFRDELAALAGRHGERLSVVHWLESVQGLPSAAGLAALARPYAGREAFVCGPEPFTDLASGVLAGLGAPRVRLERFTTLEGDPFAAPPGEEPDEEPDGGSAAAAEVEVVLDGETTTLPWPRNRRLLDVLLAAGLDAPYSCREGSCAACACVLVEGEAAMEHNQVLDRRDVADGLLLACQALPVSERVRVTYDG
ncbi:ferredoxin--NADP reductase [Microbispora sp. ATCC PTA-5024]|uniref:ferredoxin--NADP reductase n=1 Tax=Microbispora sp. ATCC PTA-5024 TaxID=316330 RepID=UPI0003DCBEE8|nr:ferredoxin--NADP reductase [Microbispora sp. ATCC PTA-5024]ETK36991.1 3-ketosteroid-9-alpha-hydroxylase reductase subunit [Microbispora sp. ATCC PTA-5024]